VQKSIDENKAIVLALFIAHFSIIRRWMGNCGTRVVCKLTGRADMADINDMMIFTPLRISSSDRVTKATQIINDSSGRAALFDIGNIDRHSKALIALCDSFMELAGEQTAEHYVGIPLLYTYSGIVDDVRDGAFVIGFGERFCADRSEIIKLLPHLVELESIKKMAESYLDSVMTKMGHALIYAVCLTYPRLRDQDNLEYFSELIRTVEIMEEEAYSDQEEIVASFARQLFRWWCVFGTQHLISLPELDSVALGRISDSVYVNTKSLYLSKDVFDSLIEVMMHTYTKHQIMEALKEKGVLKCFEGSTYMDKMSYLNVAGLTEKIRMYHVDKQILFNFASANGIDLVACFL